MRVSVDVDGILACFFDAYEKLTIEVAGVDLFGTKKYPKALPQTWNWPETFGYSNETMKEVWNRIKTDPYYWYRLNPLPGAANFIKLLQARDREAYFITDRPGLASQRQTAQWLMQHGYAYPSVILSGKHATKGDVCSALKIDVYIDDKTESVQDVLEKSPNTKMLMLS